MKLHIIPEIKGLLAAGLFFVAVTLYAQETGSFMRIPSDASSLALAGCKVVQYEPSAISMPVFLPFDSSRIKADVSAMSWMRNLDGAGYPYYSASAMYKPCGNNAVYAAFRTLRQPSVEITDEFGNVLGQGRPQDLSVEAGYASAFARHFTAFLTARYLRLNPGYGKIANAFSADAGVGFRHMFDKPAFLHDISAMVSLNDIGTSPDYGYGHRSLPWTAGAGASLGMQIEENHSVRLGMQADMTIRPTEYWGFTGAFGTEYTYKDFASLRAGYHLGHPAKGDMSWWSCGLGFGWRYVFLDIAVIIAGQDSPLRNTAVATLRFEL